MTSIDDKDLFAVSVGTDHNLWYRYAADGALDKATEKNWGGSGMVLYEPFSCKIMDGGFQVYYINASNGHLMAKAASSSKLNDGNVAHYDLGGVLAGSPVAVYYDEGNKRVEVFAVGMDGQVWGCFYAGKWTWERLSVTSMNPVAFQPEKLYASTDGKRRIDLVAVSLSNDLYHRYFNGSQWSAWTSVGMNAVGSRPLCWTPHADRVDIVCKDARDHKMAHTANDGGVWLGWQKIGGDVQVHLDQSASYCSTSATRYHLGAISKDGGNGLIAYLNFEKSKLGTWTNFTNLGGVIANTPKLAHRAGVPYFFSTGMDSAIYYKYQSGGGFSSWIKLTSRGVTRPV